MPRDNEKDKGKMIAHLLTEKWAMSRERVLETIRRVMAGPTLQDTQAGCGYSDDDEAECGYMLKDGVATISIVGVLVKYPSWWGTSTIEVQAAIQRALDDFAVRSIALVIDSPGGYGLSCSDLADFVFLKNGTGSGQKPIDAVISSLAASAGYWVASQCRKVTCNQAGDAGCIGVYTVLLDDTKWQEEIGLKWEVISSGGVKGLGADGKVTPELRADVQREIDDSHALFLAAVERGRGSKLTKSAKELGDGRSWIAAKAKELGLIDEVASVDAAMTAITSESQVMTIEQLKAGLAEHPELTAGFVDQGKKAGVAEAHQAEIARMSAIEAACPGRPALAIKQFKAGADADQVRSLVAELDAEAATKKAADEKAAADLKAKDAEIERLKAELGTQGAVGTVGAAKIENKEQATDATTAAASQLPTDRAPTLDEAKAAAGAEYDAGKATFKSSSKERYVNYRAAELMGQVKTLTRA